VRVQDLNEIWLHDKGTTPFFSSLFLLLFPYLSFSRRYLMLTVFNKYKSKEAIHVQLCESAEIRKRESLEMVEATLVPHLILMLQHTSISNK